MPKSIHFHSLIKLLLLRYLIITGVFLGVSPELVLAAENWGLCRTPSFKFVDTKDSTQSATEIRSQSVIRENNEIVRFSGQVELNRDGQKIRADELIIDNLTEQLQANGGVIFEDANFRLQTETLTLDQKNE